MVVVERVVNFRILYHPTQSRMTDQQREELENLQFKLQQGVLTGAELDRLITLNHIKKEAIQFQQMPFESKVAALSIGDILKWCRSKSNS